MLDSRAKRFLDLVNASVRDRSSLRTVDELRAASVALADFAGVAPLVERGVDALKLPSRELPIRIYSPKSLAAAKLPGLVYFHGGGCVSGSLDTHDAICAWLSDSGRCRIVSVAYRLAPEARFPAAFDDAFESAMAVAADPRRWSIDPQRLGIGGDSAGGHLAALAARRVIDAGANLALLLLLCPVIDLLGRTESRRALATGYLIDETTMRTYWDLCRAEGMSPEEPALSPLGAGFGRLPRALIHTAEYDPLRDEGARYARELAAAGVEVEHVEHAGLIHHFYGLAGVIPAAKAAMGTIGASLRDAFAQG